MNKLEQKDTLKNFIQDICNDIGRIERNKMFEAFEKEKEKRFEENEDYRLIVAMSEIMEYKRRNLDDFPMSDKFNFKKHSEEFIAKLKLFYGNIGYEFTSEFQGIPRLLGGFKINEK